MALLFFLYCLPIFFLYFIFCLIFSLIRIGKIKPGAGHYFYIARDAIHADYVFESTFFEDVFTPRAKFIKIGWGDRKIFLETRTWAELKIEHFLTAFFGISETVLRIEFIDEIPPNSKLMEADERQIFVIKQHILDSFYGEEIKKKPEFYQKGNYYNSNLRYNCVTNCNNWVNRGLFLARLTNRVWCPVSLWL